MYRIATCYAANLSEHSQRTSATKIVSISYLFFSLHLLDVIIFVIVLSFFILQCFDAVGWVTGRASAVFRSIAPTIALSLLFGTGLS